jgi:hypothetical protein
VSFSTASAPTTTDRANLELSYRPDIDWRLAINGGAEASDVVTGTRQRYDNYGASLDWTPSAHTRVSLRGDQRFFGRSYGVLVEHRLPRSVFRYSDTRDVTNGADLAAAATAPPAAPSTTPTAPTAATGYVANGITVTRQQDLSWSWQAVRTSVSISGFRTSTDRIDSAAGASPAGPNDNVDTSGYAGSLGYKLTPYVNLAITGSRSISHSRTTGVGSDLKTLSLGLTSQLGRRTSGVLSVRYSVYGGVTDPYHETALSGSVTMRF